MYKALILLIFGYSLAALADKSKVEDACLGIKKLTPNTLSFFYNQQNDNEKTYFYVKAMKAGESPEKNLDAIMAMGKNLKFVQNNNAYYYQVPEQTQKLFIVKTNVQLTKIDPLAQVIPVEKRKKRHTRNVSIYPQPLLPETKQQADKEPLNICELVL
ncbi:MAG: hypothetical protein ABL903_13885 [Methylococcales bacterium]